MESFHSLTSWQYRCEVGQLHLFFPPTNMNGTPSMCQVFNQNPSIEQEDTKSPVLLRGSLEQWVSTGCDFLSRGGIWQCQRTFLTVMTAGKWGASDIYWVEAMDANTLQCIGQPSTTENYPAQNVHETESCYYWPNSATSNGHDGGWER